MRDLLIPIFGEGGAVVAQFIITVVIVLGLIGAVWWLMRRYSGVHFGGIGRGRVPRLAIVDVMAVDRRRRLVLVRRDNVEHLLLIGGPSDVVVEGAIHRVRQRGAQAAAQAATARAAMHTAAIEPPPAAEPEIPLPERFAVDEPPAEAPIPFPMARSALRAAASGNARPELRSVQPAPAAAAEEEPASAAAASFIAPQRPTRLQAIQSRLAAPPPPPAPPPEAPPPVDELQVVQEDLPPAYAAQALPADVLLSVVMTAEAAPPPEAPPEPDVPATFAEAEREAAELARQSAFDLGDVQGDLEGDVEGIMEAPATAAEQEEAMPDEAAEEAEEAPAEPVSKVSDLEREMARLLDEITTRRST